MSAAATIITMQLYSELVKAVDTIAKYALGSNLEARRKAIEMAHKAYIQNPNNANLQVLNKTLVCNFATVVISYRDQSNAVLYKSITDKSMGGSPNDPSTHGEQKAWVEVAAGESSYHSTIILPVHLSLPNILELFRQKLLEIMTILKKHFVLTAYNQLLNRLIYQTLTSCVNTQ